MVGFFAGLAVLFFDGIFFIHRNIQLYQRPRHRLVYLFPSLKNLQPTKTLNLLKNITQNSGSDFIKTFNLTLLWGEEKDF